jgi:hypothetical protein
MKTSFLRVNVLKRRILDEDIVILQVSIEEKDGNYLSIIAILARRRVELGETQFATVTLQLALEKTVKKLITTRS